ncbi:hypothetical protein O4H66_23265 [Comamonadaceae bacterium G21597-S1]|nr:hypothetical protein [Comamonadaceae bacterium G21597-S1]
MRWHPALLMSLVWLLCAAGFGLLPFQLVDREMTWYGGLIQVILIGSFCAGSIMAWSLRSDDTDERREPVNVAWAQLLLMVFSAIATIALLLDAQGREVFDLAASYSARSDSADALFKGEASESTIWFQIAFLTYPAAYVFTGLHLLYAPRLQPLRLIVFGFAPFILVGMVMGGRMPILYGLLLTWLAFRQRRRMMDADGTAPTSDRRPLRTMVIWTLMAGAAMYYFAQVFLVRAEAAGGAEAMFEVARQRWGITFEGPLADSMFEVLGMETSYLIFIFVWYVVQGLVIGNELFFSYAEPAQWGAYGIDLFSALLRRVNPEQLTRGFDALMDLGTYGFFPSAWGSLFVDLRYGAIAFALAWGAFAGLTYRRIVIEKRVDWQLVGPFISIGILCSTINTPLGFTNGLVTHFWLVVAFFALHRSNGDRPAEGDTTHAAAP